MTILPYVFPMSSSCFMIHSYNNSAKYSIAWIFYTWQQLDIAVQQSKRAVYAINIVDTSMEHQISGQKKVLCMWSKMHILCIYFVLQVGGSGSKLLNKDNGVLDALTSL